MNETKQKSKKPLTLVENSTKENSQGNQVNQVVLTKDSDTSIFKKSTCKDCLYWLPCDTIIKSNVPVTLGKCTKDTPSVNSGIVAKEGPVFIYPLTEETCNACSHFKKQ